MKKTALYGKPKKKRSVTKIVVAVVLIALGVLLCVTAAIVEMRQYPWRQRLGLKAPDPSELPDPPALVPSRDAYFVFVVDVPSPAPDQEMETPEVLPGEEEPEETPEASPQEAAQETPAQKQYTVIGTMKIPALEISANLLDGTGKELKYGAGHMPITAYPGQEGNCVIAGHRTYPFRYLDLLRNGDSIIIRFGDKLYTYSVYDSFEVEPTETWVLDPVEGHPYSLTLITCTPYMVSSHRLIVRAELVKINDQDFNPNGTEDAQAEKAAESPEAAPESAGETAPEGDGAAETAGGGTESAAAGSAESESAGGAEISPGA